MVYVKRKKKKRKKERKKKMERGLATLEKWSSHTSIKVTSTL